MRRLGVLLVLGLSASCGLDERSDFLIGRQCLSMGTEECDDGQKCLPHENDPRPGDFRCRDRQSFETVNGIEPPLAYCQLDDDCPGDLVCNADRIRAGRARRPLVCKRPDDVFAPPPES